ncbi:hypothetical protein [Streptomyces atrovirens]|uniref:Uncharacterized protein n=1 Tax=Streptomyces atrovirens TaxID=285556 RepID=A0ABW0DVB8_9ACTN
MSASQSAGSAAIKTREESGFMATVVGIVGIHVRRDAGTPSMTTISAW